MQNQSPVNQLSIQELREKNELMDLAIDLAFKERMYTLLKNPDSDPETVLTYLKMHEQREQQKLKEYVAKLKQQEIELNERKHDLNERKFQCKTQHQPAQEQMPAPAAPVPAAAADKAIPPQEKPPILVNSPAPVSRHEKTVMGKSV